MNTSEKLITIAENMQKVYNKGYEDGKGDGEDVYVLVDGVDITINDGIVTELLKNDFSEFDAIAFPEGITGIDLVDKTAKKAGQPLVANKVIMPSTLKTITQYSFANRVIFEGDDDFDENSPTIKKQGGYVWEDASVKVRVKEFVLNKDLNIDKTPNVFAQNLYLEKINIPLKAEAIAGANFIYCINLAKIIIPASVKAITSTAFYLCDNLTIYGYKYTTAETFALSENIPFVVIQSDSMTEFEQGYFFGGLDYSPQETVRGEAIGIADISPIEHNLEVVVRKGNLLPYPYVNSTQTISGVTFTDNGDGTITLNGTATAYISYFLTNKGGSELKPNTTYSFYGFSNGSSSTYEMRVTDNKTQAYSSYSKPTAFYYADISYFQVYLYIRTGSTFDNYVVKPIIAEGAHTSLPYTPYIEDISTVKLFKSGEGAETVMYDVKTDGTVESVKSLYPNTTLYTDTSGAVIDCTYYQDGKKVKENLIDMILELGGVINE